MPDSCPICLCRRAINKGDTIFQLARGTYCPPYITPTYDYRYSVIGEWHENCFRRQPVVEIGKAQRRRASSIEVRPQEQPYTCSFCGAEIEQDEKIFYGVIGDRPAPGYVRPERRGYALQFVAHDVCWTEPDLDETRRLLVRRRKLWRI